MVIAVRPPHLVSRRRPGPRRRPRSQRQRQLDVQEPAAAAAADSAILPPAPQDHLAQPLHALVEAVARDGARGLQVPLSRVAQVPQAQLRLQLVGLERSRKVLVCGGGGDDSMRLSFARYCFKGS